MSQVIGNVLSGITVITGVILINPSDHSFLMFLLYFVLLVIVAALINWFFDTKIGNSVKTKKEKWIGKRSKKQYGSRLHSVQ